MPIYEYACAGCGHRFEIRQSYSDEPITECTECGAQVRRVLHPAGVIFKGSGWYATDSRKAGADSTPAEKTETPSTPEPAAAPTKKEAAAVAADD